MSKNAKLALKIILMFLMLSLPLILIIIYGTNGDWFSSQRGIVQAGLIIGLITLLVGVLLILFKTKFFYGMMIETIERDNKKLDNKSTKHKESTKSLSIDKTRYHGITKRYLRLNWITGITLITLIILFACLADTLLLIFPITIIAYQYFTKFIVVSPKGILYRSLFKSKFLKWEQVKVIGVSANLSPFALVYISNNTIKHPQYWTARDVEKMINFKLKPKMIHHIMAYWDEEIINLQNIKHWRRYLHKNGTAIK